MSERRRGGRRVVYRSGASGGEGGEGGGLLAFGLKDKDRSLPARKRKKSSRGAPAKSERASRGRTKPEDAGKRTGGRKRRRRGGRGGRGGGGRGNGGGLFGPIRRAVRGLVYWTVVFAVIAGGALAALVGYYGTKLPPPDEWVVPTRAASVRVLAADGAVITNQGDTAGQSLSLREMPPHLPEAVIAIEDRRFYWHYGIDPIGLARALAANWQAGGVVQGGSTITQQLAKNLFLKPERTLERKIQELILAVWLEMRLSKKEILELYLNRAYLGAGAYGVDAAAHRYFGKSAREVTLAEAATLAGLLKAPSRYSPVTNPAAAEARRQLVLTAMQDAGFIDARRASLAMSSEVVAVRDVAGGSGRYVADWVMDLLPGFVGTVEEDIVVDTTIDLRLQAAAARAVAEVLAADDGKHGVSQGALVAMDPSGAVKALVGGSDYGRAPYNRAVYARRQPGSAFKPFVYLTALERGLIPESVRVDRPVSIRGWSPENYAKEYRGPVTLQTALALSLNTVSAQLTAEVGPEAVAATARRLGIASPLMATPSIALGTSEVTLVELTGAFAPFANGGVGVFPHVIRRIATADGEVLYQRSGTGRGQVVDPVQVAMMNAMLAETIARGTGKRAAIAGWPAAGKTGTSQDFRDAWFIGYTAPLIAGVWYGNDDNRPTSKASGSNLPAITWQYFMSEALRDFPVVALPGNYRVRDPGDFALGGLPQPADARYGEDGQPLVLAPRPVAPAAGRLAELPPPPAGGWVDYPAVGPVPPAAVGASPPADLGPRPRPRRGFFQRLFGG